jgi:glycosyltransferase involved in cell wall biosynthesis
MKQLRVYAPIAGPEGYSFFARDLLMNLDEAGVQCHLTAFQNWGPWHLDLEPQTLAVLSQMLERKPYPQPGPISNLNICLPEQAQLLDSHRNCIYTMFESDRIPDVWVDALRMVDEIFVPTEFNHWSFSKSGVSNKKITILPVGFNPSKYHPEVTALPLHDRVTGESPMDYPIRFLVVCEITNRKNFFGTLQTFFKVAERIGVNECCLVLKAGSYSRRVSTAGTIKKVKKALIQRKEVADLPYHIFNYTPLVPEIVHPSFIKIGTHYLSTSLGEGWDLTAMQAAACGLNLFIPEHTAYKCWLDQSVASFLPVGHVSPASQDNGLQKLYSGSHWYNIDPEGAVDVIVSSIKDPDLLERKRSLMASFLHRYHWKTLIPLYQKALHL